MLGLKALAGPGPGRFPTLYLRAPATCLAHNGSNTSLTSPQQRRLDGRMSGKHIGVSHVWLGPPNRHIQGRHRASQNMY